MRKQSIKMDRQKFNENHLIDQVPRKNPPSESALSDKNAAQKQPFAKRLGYRIGKIFGKH